MNWDIAKEILIALITSTFTSFLSYRKAVKENEKKLEEVKIKAETELKIIKEESKKETNKIKAECESRIKENEENMKNEVLVNLFKNPDNLKFILEICEKAQIDLLKNVKL